MASIHVIYGGRTEDLTFEQVFPAERLAGLGIAAGTVVTAANVTQDQIKGALAQHYDVGIGEFADLFVETNPNGNVTVRPNTPFGA